MSIATAFANAVTGLKATSRQASVLSSNVANATTPGYARREVELSARDAGGTGQGVRIDGVVRDVDLFLLNDRRAAQAARADVDTRAAFLDQLEGLIGNSDEAGSLLSRINALDRALVTAAARPESPALLGAAVAAANDLVSGLHDASTRIQSERMRADKAIANATEMLNTSLGHVEELNRKITIAVSSGHDATALMDQRARIIDGIAELVPVRELERENGQVALVSSGGAILIDGRAARLEFTTATFIDPEMSIESGDLSQVMLNGHPITMSGNDGLLAGGRLQALFALRDDLAPAGQARVDALARDLVERFSAPGPDTTLLPGEPGLFTDAGDAIDPARETGVAARIALNVAVDPDAGGSILRLRDGLGATTPGPEGDASLLNALVARMSEPLATGSGALTAGTRSLAGLAAELLSDTSAERVSVQSEQAFREARFNALVDMEQARGVDMDQEMQTLLVLEQAYAANARVIQALDDMLDTILRIR